MTVFEKFDLLTGEQKQAVRAVIERLLKEQEAMK